MRTIIVEFFRQQAPPDPQLLDHALHSSQSRASTALDDYHARKRTVLRLAACIEADAMKREQWFSRDPIAVFHGRTAEELLMDGEENALMAFLADLICQDIGAR